MEDLTKLQKCQNGGKVHAQEWALACTYIHLQQYTKKIKHHNDSLFSNNIYFEMHIQLLVTNGELSLEL